MLFTAVRVFVCVHVRVPSLSLVYVCALYVCANVCVGSGAS